MAFYDDWNFDGLKFLSKIKDNPEFYIFEPCQDFLSIIKHLKSLNVLPHMKEGLNIAEIGIGFGATALQALQMLDKEDTYYCFDFEKSLKAFAEDLQARDFGINCQIVMAGNSQLKWDSYNWALSNMIFHMRERNEAGVFDAVYLDGAHTFLHDGLAVCLLKELIKDGGFLVLDDVFWNYSNDLDRDYIKEYLPKNQIEDMQILRVQEIFLSNDPNWEKLSSPENYRSIFKKHLRWS